MLKTFAVSLMFIAGLAFLMLSGCASDRYLSKEDDDKMREVCEARGCAVLPGDTWEEIKKQLGKLLGV